MTHDRGGAALIGAGASVVLVTDLLYATSHWHGSFPRAFMVALTTLGAIALIALGLRFIRPIGSGRRGVRWTQRAVNVALVVVILVLIGITRRVGGNETGAIFGEVAGVAGGFALYAVIWLILKRPNATTRPRP